MKGIKILLLFLGLVYSGCEFLALEDEVVLQPPNLPMRISRMNPSFSWRYSWLSGPHSLSVREVDSSEVLRISLPRNLTVLVIAKPIFHDSLSPWKVHPAGYIRAADQAGNAVLQLRWDQGFAAELLMELAVQGGNLLHFNIRRFKDAVEVRSAGKSWNLNRKKIAQDMNSDSFRYYSIRLSEAVKSFLPLPEGLWYRESMLQPPIAVQQGGWYGELVEGFHRLIRIRDSLVAEIWIEAPQPAALMLRRF